MIQTTAQMIMPMAKNKKNNLHKRGYAWQGIQHYEPVDRFGGEEGFKIQVKNDNFKRKFCEENKIKLIEIPYYIEDLEEYLLALL